MCGIAGIFYKSKERKARPETVGRMLGVLAHRGPDGAGVYVDGPFGMGMCRLSIIDEKEHRMPYVNEDGRLRMAYNGEVYNHRDLLAGLEQEHRIVEGSDGETVLHGWEEKGISLLDDLNGMYAFAIYDRERKELTLARDKAGEKPLYYYEDSEVFVFASEIKAILAVARPEINPTPVSYRCFEFTSGSETLFKDVHALEPGDYLTHRDGRTSVRSYWKIWDHLIEVKDDEKRILSDLTDLLVDAILLRKENSSHRIGCMVSGGVDSALVACLCEPDYIYTGNYDISEEFDELPYALRVAEKIGRDLVIVRPTREDYLQYKDAILYHLDMPATWTSFNLFMVLRRASRDIRVVLSGEGADELFGGYHRYHLLNHDQKIYELQAMEKYHFLIQKYYGSPEERYAKLVNRNENQFDEEGQRYLIDLIEDYFSRTDGVIHGMGLTDFYTTMQVLLTMADRMSMAFGIENRSPFLDHRLLQYAFSMPEKYKIKDGTTKYIVKKIAEKFIPEEIVNRIDKRGFVAPLNIWFGWGKDGKYSRNEYRNAVYEDWKRIFFGKGKRARRIDRQRPDGL